MPKKLLTGAGVAAVLVVGVLLGSLTMGSAFAHSSSTPTPTQASVQTANDDATEAVAEGPDVDAVEEQVEQNDELQSPSYTGSITVDESQYEGMSEAEEAAALQQKATISTADAEQTALAANPGTSVVKTELENENGTVVYGVELSNGKDVKVDAGAGVILHTEADGADSED